MSYYIRTLKCILSIFVIFYAAQATAATLTYSGDQLTGVNGVEALGGTWNVAFYDGTFDYVDSLYSLSSPFHTYEESLALTTALAGDMSVLGSGVLDPEDINGCSNYNVSCAIVTAHTFTTFLGDEPDRRVTGFSVTVSPSQTISGETTSTTIRDMDFNSYAYAVWEVSAVPVPAAVWLFGSGLIGLIGLIGFARRKKA